MSSTLTVRIDDEMKSRLQSLAEATERSRSYLVGQAIRDYVEINEWQISEIQSAVTEADANDFATADEMRAFKSRWLDAD